MVWIVKYLDRIQNRSGKKLKQNKEEKATLDRFGRPGLS
jgi:hypothetical protein